MLLTERCLRFMLKRLVNLPLSEYRENMQFGTCFNGIRSVIPQRRAAVGI